MSSRISQYSPAFHSFFNKEITSEKTKNKLDFISSIWDYDHFRRLDEKTGNAHGVIKVFKESMLLRHFLTYWGRRVCILKVLFLLKTNFTQQDTKNFRITNRLRRLFLLIIHKRLNHSSQVYRIIYLLQSNPPSVVVPKLALHRMTLIHI